MEMFTKRKVISSLQSLICVRLFATPWTTMRQASLSITNSQSPPRLMTIELVMPSSHLILCCPLLLLPSIFPSIRIFSNESALRIRWPKYWSFSFSISPSSEHPSYQRPLIKGLISFTMDWLDLLAVQGTLKNLLQLNINIHQKIILSKRHQMTGRYFLIVKSSPQRSYKIMDYRHQK